MGIPEKRDIHKKCFNNKLVPKDFESHVKRAWTQFRLLSSIFCGRVCNANCYKRLERNHQGIYENDDDLKLWYAVQEDLHKFLSGIPLIYKFAKCPACSIVESFSCFPLLSVLNDPSKTSDFNGSYPCYRRKKNDKEYEITGETALLLLFSYPINLRQHFASLDFEENHHKYIKKHLYKGIAVAKYLEFLHSNISILKHIELYPKKETEKQIVRRIYQVVSPSGKMTMPEFYEKFKEDIEGEVGYLPSLYTLRRYLKGFFDSSPGRRPKSS